MPFETLQDVLTMNSVIDDGIDFFKANPLQFIELIKKNHLLATDFAKSKSLNTEALETMLRNAYKYNNKFFSEIFNLMRNSQTAVAFKNPRPSNGEVIDALVDTGKVFVHDTRAVNGYYAYVYDGYQIFWAPEKDYKSGGDKTNLLYPDKNTLFTLIFPLYRSATKDKEIYNVLINICKDLTDKLQNPHILQGEFLSDGAKTNRIFPYMSCYYGPITHQFFAKCVEFMTVAQVLREMPQNDSLNILINDYGNKKIIMDAVFVKLRLAAAQNPQAFRAQFLDKFPYNILHEMQKKNAALALEFYNIEPETIAKKYPEHVLDTYPKPIPRPAPAAIMDENPNPIPVLSVSNFIREVRTAHISELNKLLSKYPGNITQQNVAADILRQARELPDNSQTKAHIQLDINLLNNPNSALHYYLRGYVLSRLRTQLIADLQTELLNKTRTALDLNPDVGTSSSRLQIIPRVLDNEREEVKKELQKNTMEML